jgi:hypothetical protein
MIVAALSLFLTTRGMFREAIPVTLIPSFLPGHG